MPKKLFRRAAVSSLLAAASHAAPAKKAGMTEDFSSYAANACLPDGASFGEWISAYSGYGCVKVVSEGGTRWLQAAPKAAAKATGTHASLVLGPSFEAPYTFTTELKTERHTRLNTAPNPWEVGWVVWNFKDNDHFYYFYAGPGGWELGKRDPSHPGGQRFLATGAQTFPIGRRYSIRVVQDGATITVSVDGTKLASFTDEDRAYLSGRIGLYNEDAETRVSSVTVSAGPS